MFCDPGGSKSRLAKAAGAEPCGKIGNEKLHAVVARSRFISQNAKKASLSEHVRTLLDVEVWKKCTQLWRETHFDVTMLKTHKNTTCLGRFLTLRCRKSARRCGGEHISQSKSAKHTTCEPLLDVEPTLQLQLQLQLPLPLQLQQHDTTLQPQLQLQLHYFTTTTTTTFTLHYNHTTLHQAVVHPVTTATTPKSTTPATFRSISGFALTSMHRNNKPLLQVSDFWNFCHRLVRYYVISIVSQLWPCVGVTLNIYIIYIIPMISPW